MTLTAICEAAIVDVSMWLRGRLGRMGCCGRVSRQGKGSSVECMTSEEGGLRESSIALGRTTAI